MLVHERGTALPATCCDYAIYLAPKGMRDIHFSVNLQLEIIDMLHFIIIALFVLLLLSVVRPKDYQSAPVVQTASGIGCPDRFNDHIARAAGGVIERSG